MSEKAPDPYGFGTRPWTVREAADYLSKTDETVRRWLRAGKLASLGKLPDGEWRIDPESVRGLLKPARQRQGGHHGEIVRARLDMAWAKRRRQA